MQNSEQPRPLSAKQKFITALIVISIIGFAVGVVGLVFKVSDALIDAQPLPLKRFESQSVEILVSNKTGAVFQMGGLLLSKDAFFFIRHEKDTASLRISGDGTVTDNKRKKYVEIPSVDIHRPTEMLGHFLHTSLPNCSVEKVGLSDVKNVLMSNEPTGLMVSVESRETGNLSSSLYVLSFEEGRYHMTVTESTENYVEAAPTHVRRGLDRYTCVLEKDDPFIRTLSALISSSVLND